jgi:hypothetical protein
MKITDVSKFAFLEKLHKELFEDYYGNAIIAGGVFSSILADRKIKDIDIFTGSPDDLISFLGSKGIKQTFQNDWVANFKYKKFIIQIIKKHTFTTVRQCIDEFDFTIVCAAYDGKEFVTHERFFMDNSQKRIVVNKLPKPLSSFKRLAKYCSRGYSACPVGLAAIAKSINGLQIDWSNPSQNEIEFYPDGTPSFRGLD